MSHIDFRPRDSVNQAWQAFDADIRQETEDFVRRVKSVLLVSGAVFLSGCAGSIFVLFSILGRAALAA